MTVRPPTKARAPDQVASVLPFGRFSPFSTFSAPKSLDRVVIRAVDVLAGLDLPDVLFQ